MFGPEVAHIVSGVTKLSTLPFDSSQARQAESIRKMILAMADDIRVILIKLADRLHNMRTLQFHKHAKKQQDIAQETLDIYCAHRRPAGHLLDQKELEDTSFMYLIPEEYREIKRPGEQGPGRAGEVHRNGQADHPGEDGRSTASTCEVLGRYKHFYSIYQKMITQNLDFEEVYDIIAFRIILDTDSPVLRGPGAHPLPLEAHRQQVQGLHRPSQAQHVPVPAHHGHRPLGRAGGNPDPHPGDGPGGQIRHRRPLELQGGQAGR